MAATEEDGQTISRLWADTQARLPPGWSLDSLRCASTGLDPDDRSADWVAVAVGPGGEERSNRDEDAQRALDGLARKFEAERP